MRTTRPSPGTSLSRSFRGNHRECAAVIHSAILEVIDLKNGERIYRERLPLSEVYGSAALAGKLIYVFDTRGKAVVFKPGQTFERVAINQCEGTGCCPVFAGNQLYVRSQQALCCVSAAAKDEK
jgi:hypothetical protein